MVSNCNRNSTQNRNKTEGRYANYFKVGHNAFEFVIDFGQYYSETEDAKLYTRIVTNPCYAKSLLVTLQESIARYEKAFGAIKEDKDEA